MRFPGYVAVMRTAELGKISARQGTERKPSDGRRKERVPRTIVISNDKPSQVHMEI
jgi:hypothetical protein